jgi:hypothetical protein
MTLTGLSSLRNWGEAEWITAMAEKAVTVLLSAGCEWIKIGVKRENVPVIVVIAACGGGSRGWEEGEWYQWQLIKPFDCISAVRE